MEKKDGRTDRQTCVAKHAGKPSPTRLWPVALEGKDRKRKREREHVER